MAKSARRVGTAHHGHLDATLELESEPGAGSTFRVRFPHHYPAAPRPAAG